MTSIPQELMQATAHMREHLSNLDKNEKPCPNSFLVHLREYTPLIKEGETKDFKIISEVTPAGEPMTVISMRQWFMTGYKPLEISFETDTKIYKLTTKDGGLLMSDSPQELFMQFSMLNKAKGRVLTSGLGLGLFTRMVAMKSEVIEVIVVEKEEQIIQLYNQTKHPIFQSQNKVRIVHDDIRNFLKTTKEKFDYIYLDIHYGTSCGEYIETVLPLRKILDKRFKGVPADFWAEDEMKAQYDPNFKKNKRSIK